MPSRIVIYIWPLLSSYQLIGSEDGGIQFTEVQPVSEGQNRPVAVRSLHVGLSNTTAAMKSSTTAPPVFLINCLPLSSRYFISLYIRLYISFHLLVFGIQFSSVSQKYWLINSCFEKSFVEQCIKLLLKVIMILLHSSLYSKYVIDLKICEAMIRVLYLNYYLF